MKINFRLHTLKDYLDFLRKRTWWIILPCLIAGPLGSVIIYKLPNIYESSTVILVEPQKIDPNFVRNPVSVNIKDRMNQIRNKILSSTNLDLIVKNFRLYEDQRIPLTDQAKVDLLRRRIQIYVDHPGGYEQSQVSYFSVSYEDKSPEMAQAVTAEVAAQFLSEEEKQSKEKIVKTSNFIDNQIAQNLTVMEAKKKELSQVRLQNMVNMPFDAATYAKQLDTVETEISGVREGIDRWQDKVLSLERDLSTTPQTVTRQVQVFDENESAEAGDDASQPQHSIPSVSTDITALEAEIDRLKRSYTDEHPDVRRLTKRLEALRAQTDQSSQATAKAGVSRPVAEPAVKSVTSPNLLYRRLTAQVAQVKRTIETQQTRLAVLEKQKAGLQERLGRWPQITQLIADKTDEINSLEAQYNALKAKQQEARLSVELSNRAQTEQFRIQDPANFPELPIKPARPRLFLLTWALGLGLGVALALARDLTDQSIRTPSDVTSIHSVPILVSIPPIQTEQERISARRRHRYLLGLYAFSGASLVGILLFAVLNEGIIRWILDYINIYFT
jgi:polysaccharide biosynthesis transport protein